MLTEMLQQALLISENTNKFDQTNYQELMQWPTARAYGKKIMSLKQSGIQSETLSQNKQELFNILKKPNSKSLSIRYNTYT